MCLMIECGTLTLNLVTVYGPKLSTRSERPWMLNLHLFCGRAVFIGAVLALHLGGETRHYYPSLNVRTS